LPILKRGKRSRVAALDCEELLQLAKLFSLAELRGELIEKMNLGCNSETGKGQAFSAPLDVTPGEQPASPFTWRTMDGWSMPGRWRDTSPREQPNFATEQRPRLH
jgi:hypothetical protein